MTEMKGNILLNLDAQKSSLSFTALTTLSLVGSLH